MRHFTAPFLSLLLMLLLLGCTQGGIPAACANSSLDKLANCIYTASVLEQNPYSCYSLKESLQREKCLRDASDSAAKKLLEQMTPAERAKVFEAISGAVNASGLSIPIAPPSSSPENPNSSAASNPPGGVSEADSQAYAVAVESSDMAPCATISDASTRASCITQVAIRVKNPAMCSQFTQKTDLDLCNFYAKGGEQAK